MRPRIARGAGGAHAAANARTVGNRSSGSLDSARAMAASSFGGTSGRSVRTRRGVSTSACAMIDRAPVTLNGGSPTSISNSTHASAYSSLRPSAWRSPAICSGLMYAGVPSE